MASAGGSGFDPEARKNLVAIKRKIEVASRVGSITALLIAAGSITAEFVIGGEVFILLAGVGILATGILVPLALVK